MEDESRVKHMSVKELRKAVTALRKTGCPAVSRMKKAQLLVEMTVHTAANKMRATAKPVVMDKKGRKTAVAKEDDNQGYTFGGMREKTYKGMSAEEALALFLKNKKEGKKDTGLDTYIAFNFQKDTDLGLDTEVIEEEVDGLEDLIAFPEENNATAEKVEKAKVRLAKLKKILASRGVSKKKSKK